jgi:hypothetical protein
MTDSPEVRRVAATLCPAWHASYKLDVARRMVNGDTDRAVTMALDAQPGSLDAAVRNFFHPHGSDQMPMTSPSAAMPASLNDNYTGSRGAARTIGGMGYHRRNGNASDQPRDAEAFLSAFEQLDETVQLQIFAALASYYGVDIGEDQGSTLRLPNGQGVDPADLIAPEQGIAGSFAEGDPVGTGPRGNTDQRPTGAPGTPARLENLPPGMVARELARRSASDRRMAQDSRTIARNHEAFLERHPWARHVQVWG